jgi:hypothetical protein
MTPRILHMCCVLGAGAFIACSPTSGPGSEPGQDASAADDATGYSDGAPSAGNSDAADAPPFDAADASTSFDAAEASTPGDASEEITPTAVAFCSADAGMSGDTCSDGTKDGAETDTDCGGGVCAPCSTSQGCLVDSDCATNKCSGSVCQEVPATCSNGHKDGSETDVDCGGTACPSCGDFAQCLVPSDCTSGECTAGVCPAVLSVQVHGNGEVTSSDGLIACPAGACSHAYTTWPSPQGDAPTFLTLTATPAAGWHFVGWSRDCGSTYLPDGGIDPSSCMPEQQTETIQALFYPGNEASVTWAESFGSNADAWATTFDTANDVVVVGEFAGSLTVGQSTLATSSGDDFDAFLVSLDPTGAPRWLHRYGGTAGGDSATSVVSDGAGGLLVAGSITGAVSVGGAQLQCTPAPGNWGNESDFLAKYDAATGAHVWSRCLQVLSAQIAADAQGNVVVAGELGGSTDLGDGPIAVPSGTDMLYLASYSGADGSLRYKQLFSATIAATENYFVTAFVAVGPTGDVSMAGYTQFDLQIGTNTLANPHPGSQPSPFVARFNAQGEPLWSRLLSATDSFGPSGIAVDALDGIVITGPLGGTADFGCGTIAAGPGGAETYLARFDGPTGETTWQMVVPLQSSSGIAAGSTIVLSGLANPNVPIDFGIGPVEVSGNLLANLDLTGSYVWVTVITLPQDQTASLALGPSGVAVSGLGASSGGGAFAALVSP